MNCSYYRKFQENLESNIEISSIIYVPNYIVCGVAFCDKNVIKIESEFPHITLMTAEWQPRRSNNVMNTLFGPNGPLNKEYHNGDIQKMKQE